MIWEQVSLLLLQDICSLMTIKVFDTGNSKCLVGWILVEAPAHIAHNSVMYVPCADLNVCFWPIVITNMNLPLSARHILYLSRNWQSTQIIENVSMCQLSARFPPCQGKLYIYVGAQRNII